MTRQFSQEQDVHFITFFYLERWWVQSSLKGPGCRMWCGKCPWVMWGLVWFWLCSFKFDTAATESQLSWGNTALACRERIWGENNSYSCILNQGRVLLTAKLTTIQGGEVDMIDWKFQAVYTLGVCFRLDNCPQVSQVTGEYLAGRSSLVLKWRVSEQALKWLLWSEVPEPSSCQQYGEIRGSFFQNYTRI